MQFIEALKLRSKLFFLFLFITMGLFSIGFIGVTYVNEMKKNMDALYFGSLIPVTELNEIVQTYNNGLAGTVYKVSRGKISPSDAVSTIETSLAYINKKWNSYKFQFKTEEELAYLDYADLEVNHTNDYFYRVLNAVKTHKDLNRLSLNTLEKETESIHDILQKLINYEVNMANFERKKFLYAYHSILMKIGISLGIIILGILMMLFYVFDSIQKDQTRLELASKKLKLANKKLENTSYTDSLTTLHNRRYFNLIYDREIKRAKRSKSYITFMMLDIDYFKQYNDTYGHVEGDNALKSVAKVLKETLKRPGDYVFRLGGEEFGVLLSDTDETNSANIARRICDTIRKLEIKHEASRVNQFLTISVGVVCCVADNALHEEVLITRADEMLYEAKESGRDRYVITTNASNTKTA